MNVCAYVHKYRVNTRSIFDCTLKGFQTTNQKRESKIITTKEIAADLMPSYPIPVPNMEQGLSLSPVYINKFLI